MKFQILLKNGLREPIKLEKIGVNFRPLNKVEKSNLLKLFDNLFFSDEAKERIFNMKFNNWKDRYSKNFSEDERLSNLIYYRLLKERKKISKKNVQENLKKIVIIELSDEFSDFFHDKHLSRTVEMLIQTFIYTCGDYKIENLHDLSITPYRKVIFSESKEEIIYSVLNYGYDGDKLIDNLELSYDNLFLINSFLNILDKSRVRDYLMITENLFNRYSTVDSAVLNYISAIERILVKYDDDNNYSKIKQISLKFGLCLYECKKVIDDKDIKKINFCYDVRSSITHGSDIKLLNLAEKHLKYNKTLMNHLKQMKTPDKRLLLSSIAFDYLEKNIHYILKLWVDDTKKIEFLKNN